MVGNHVAPELKMTGVYEKKGICKILETKKKKRMIKYAMGILRFPEEDRGRWGWLKNGFHKTRRFCTRRPNVRQEPDEGTPPLVEGQVNENGGGDEWTTVVTGGACDPEGHGRGVTRRDRCANRLRCFRRCWGRKKV